MKCQNSIKKMRILILHQMLFLSVFVLVMTAQAFSGTLTEGFEYGLGDWRVRQVAGTVKHGRTESPVHSGKVAFYAGPSECIVDCQENSVLALEIVLHRKVKSLTYWIMEINSTGYDTYEPWFGESTLIMADGITVQNSMYYPEKLLTWYQVTVPINAYVGTLSLMFWDMSTSGVLLLDDITIIFEEESMAVAGGNHSLALKSDGNLWSWGYNLCGQLGIETEGLFQCTPAKFEGDPIWAMVAAGSSHSLAIKKNGTLWAWGDNEFGQLGRGFFGDDWTNGSPNKVGTDNDWAYVAAGHNFSLALKRDGTLWAWGDNSTYQLGQTGDIHGPDNINRKRPCQVGKDHDWALVDGGNNFVLALKKDGTLWGWGSNGIGQLGQGSSGGYLYNPTRIGTATNWKTIAAGSWHGLGVKRDGTLWAWGANNYGQLGLGSGVTASQPARVGTGTNWSAVNSFSSSSFALTKSGALYSWGRNHGGQLGLGDKTDRYTPFQIAAGTMFADVSTGGSHTLAMTTGGQLMVFGSSGCILGLGEGATGQTQPVDLGLWGNKKASFAAGGALLLLLDETQTGPAPYPDIPGMVLIPSGSFQMGDAFNEGNADELPVHTVTVSAFYMDRYEVSKALWDEVRTWAAGQGYTDLPVGGGKGPSHPVQEVNWYDAVKWANARSERDGRTPVYFFYAPGGFTTVYKTGEAVPLVNSSANGYRLPTEAEWEKAARGGAEGRRFPWADGDTISHARANYQAAPSSFDYDVNPTSGYHPDYNDGSMPYTSPVGSFAPNGYGLYDMAGNVWEWCWDWYSATYYSSSPVVNPRGPASGSYRVIRGGSWYDLARDCRAALRLSYWPDGRYSHLGFRLALSPGQ